MTPMWSKLWEWVVRFTLSPFAEMLTWVGTLFGGIVVAGAQGELRTILLGATIVALSVLPLAIQGTIQWRHERRGDVTDARESKALEYSTDAMRRAAEIEKQPRAKRVAMSQQAVGETLDSIWESFFERNPRVRVVLFLVAPSGDALRVETVRGRGESRPRDFAAGDERSEIAIDQLFSSDESIYVRDVTNLPPSWGAAGRDYATFIRLPVRTTSDAYGMLTVDSSRASDLSDRDAGALEVYASALAFFLATAARGEHNGRDRKDGGQ
jgi:transcriptional regulator with GAF, ATPase, and Fis domain